MGPQPADLKRVALAGLPPELNVMLTRWLTLSRT